MFCTNCGTEVTGKFCSNCGREVSNNTNEELLSTTLPTQSSAKAGLTDRMLDKGLKKIGAAESVYLSIEDMVNIVDKIFIHNDNVLYANSEPVPSDKQQKVILKTCKGGMFFDKTLQTSDKRYELNVHPIYGTILVQRFVGKMVSIKDTKENRIYWLGKNRWHRKFYKQISESKK